MECLSRLSLRVETEAAVHDLCVDLKRFRPDLAVVFASHHHGPEFHDLVKGIYHAINCRNLIGCAGDSIIGPTAEIEGRPAIALWVAKLPNVRIIPFVLDQEDLGTLKEPDVWHDRLGVHPENVPSFVIVGEGRSFDIESCLERMDESYPGATIVGGMASGGDQVGEDRIFLNDQVLRRGLVGVSLQGDIRIDSVVAQGCRPIGRPYVVTKAWRNVIEELGGRPALQVLREVFDGARPADRNRMRTGLQIGRLIQETIRDHEPTDFIVRSMLGVHDNRALAVADYVRPGQTVQFYVPDATSADHELHELLEAQRAADGESARGALLFSCNGRGRSFFKKPNHDIGVVNQLMNECPTAGFFASGEIGPLGGRTYVHGYTSSLILFREP